MPVRCAFLWQKIAYFFIGLENGMFKRKKNVDLHSPIPLLHNLLLAEPPFLSLVTTFKGWPIIAVGGQREHVLPLTVLTIVMLFAFCSR